jgi:hypothetical protein
LITLQLSAYDVETAAGSAALSAAATTINAPSRSQRFPPR